MAARGDNQVTPDPDESALVVRGVRTSLAGVEVLRGAGLVVRPASVHALIGHKASGKSVLKSVAGVHAPDTSVTGTAFGMRFALGDHAAATNADLRFVHQDLDPVESPSTVDNIAGARRGGVIRWREPVRRSRAAMEALGCAVDVTLPVGLWSAAERTGVAIARALLGWSGKPAVVVPDEPAGSMPAPEVRRVADGAVSGVADIGRMRYADHRTDADTTTQPQRSRGFPFPAGGIH